MFLEIDHVSKHFSGKEQSVMEDVSLSIEKGEFFSLVGPSGCGKSTLLNMIAGLEQPSEGTIKLEGKQIEKPGADRVMMFQDAALFPWLNVIDNVKFGMKWTGVSKEEQDKKAHAFLKLVKLDKFHKYRVHELSGGMRQRVALARALALDSKVLLMDEPFSALDKQTTNVLRDELAQICARTKRTMILITHSVEEAVLLSDRVAIMGSGSCGIKAIHTIDLPKPRHIESEEFLKIRKRILNEVRKEVEESEKNEFDESE